MKPVIIGSTLELVLNIVKSGRCGYGSFLRSLLSPNFLIISFHKGRNSETKANAALLQNDSVPFANFASWQALNRC